MGKGESQPLPRLVWGCNSSPFFPGVACRPESQLDKVRPQAEGSAREVLLRAMARKAGGAALPPEGEERDVCLGSRHAAGSWGQGAGTVPGLPRPAQM